MEHPLASNKVCHSLHLQAAELLAHQQRMCRSIRSSAVTANDRTLKHYSPGLACSEGSEGCSRVVAPHEQVMACCAGNDNIRSAGLPKLRGVHPSLQPTATRHNDSSVFWGCSSSSTDGSWGTVIGNAQNHLHYRHLRCLGTSEMCALDRVDMCLLLRHSL